MSYFEFRGSDEKDRFVIQLLDPAKIEHARAILSGRETQATHVQGTVIKEKASYNPRWSYHLDPASIRFFETAIEVCDSNMRFIEEHLQEVGGAFLPHAHWCPWASKLTREIPEDEIGK